MCLFRSQIEHSFPQNSNAFRGWARQICQDHSLTHFFFSFQPSILSSSTQKTGRPYPGKAEQGRSEKTAKARGLIQNKQPPIVIFSSWFIFLFLQRIQAGAASSKVGWNSYDENEGIEELRLRLASAAGHCAARSPAPAELPGPDLSWKVRSARDRTIRTIRTIQILSK